MDDEIGSKDIQEFGEFEKNMKKIRDESVNMHINSINILASNFEARKQTEWMYCLLYDYEGSSMSVDFLAFITSLCNFYFDEEYSSKIDTKSSIIPKKNIINKDTLSIHKQYQQYIVSTFNILIGMNNYKSIKTDKDNIIYEIINTISF
jgi:hypothetical protein